jgi:putative selenate reductase
MAELSPAPFADLVTRLYAEAAAQNSVFELPRKKWHVPEPGGPDLSASFHGRRVGTPVGPASGPHTQMAQNLLLAYAAGGRIIELKTVQVNDRLTIARPCIDAATIGFNIEWSQELLVEQSLREYIAGAMLIEMFRRDPVFAGQSLLGPAGEVALDMSLGYDLKGIQSAKIQEFLDGMRDASAMVDDLRSQIPSRFSLPRGLDYPRQLSRSVTLSTFHGCPANEIERICEFLLFQRGLDVIVKMNPPMLGRERLEHILHDVLGYTELRVPAHAYDSGLRFDEAVQLVGRLSTLAASRGRSFGCKFSNTLEVANHRTFFPPGNDVQYLSGQPLHVITMTLTDVFRHSVGPSVPISFSAGVDRQNFPLAVSCGFVPVTICTDLLRPGGYGRLAGYLQALRDAMKTAGASNVGEYILAIAGGAKDLPQAAVTNTAAAAEKARNDPRYRAAQNRKAPNRVESRLETFDCLTCDKCIPVCPNAANFLYPTPTADFVCMDVIIDPAGRTTREPGRRFTITRDTQIASTGDFCNECGNCDTFCPELGGPYLRKPGFFSSLRTFEDAVPRDGYFVQTDNQRRRMVGRINGVEYTLTHRLSDNVHLLADAMAELTFSAKDHTLIDAKLLRPIDAPHRVDLWVYHAMRHLLDGVLAPSHVNQINSAQPTLAAAGPGLLSG